MINKLINKRGFLAKLLEEGIKILLKKECNEIINLNIVISATSLQVIRGIIKRIYIIAKGINYKDLLFDEIELEAYDVKIIYNINPKELKFKNNLELTFKMTISECSLRSILLSKNWNWIGNKISKQILNQDKLEEIKIKDNQIVIEALEGNHKIVNSQKLSIKAENGKIYLTNETKHISINIPIEDKIYIKTISLQNNLIIASANSSISF